MPSRADRRLSPRQQDAVDAIESFTRTHHYAPTFADLAGVLRISTTAAEALVEGARKKGRVASARGVPRSLHVVRKDEAAAGSYRLWIDWWRRWSRSWRSGREPSAADDQTVRDTEIDLGHELLDGLIAGLRPLGHPKIAQDSRQNRSFQVFLICTDNYPRVYETVLFYVILSDYRL